MKRYFLISCMILITSIQAFDNSKNLTDDNLKKIEKGEIVFFDDTDNQTPGITAYFLIHASREAIWKTITDYANFPVYFPDIKKVTVFSEFKGGATVELIVDTPIKTFRYIAIRKYTVPLKEINWDRVSGDFKVNKGTWEILNSSMKDSFILRYSSYVELDGMMGKTLARLTRPGSRDRVVKLVKTMREKLEK